MIFTRKLNFSAQSVHLLNNRFLFSWMLATVIGVIAGWKVFDQINITSLEESAGSFVLMSKWFIAIGIAVSLTQWLVIHQMERVKQWFLTSTIGYIISGIIGGLLRTELINFANPVVTNLIVGATVGSIAGAIQSLGFRFPISHTSLWVLANAIGWSLGWTCFRADLFRAFLSGSVMQDLLPAILLGILLSFITGIALSWLTQHGTDVT